MLRLQNKKIDWLKKSNKPYPFVSVKNETIEGYVYLNSEPSVYKPI